MVPCDTSNVPQLDVDFGSSVVHGLEHLFPCFELLVTPDARNDSVSWNGHSSRSGGDVCGLGDEESAWRCCSLCVVLCGKIRGHVSGQSSGSSQGCENDPVLELRRAHFDGRKQIVRLCHLIVRDVARTDKQEGDAQEIYTIAWLDGIYIWLNFVCNCAG